MLIKTYQWIVPFKSFNNPSIFPSIYQSIHISIHLSIHLFIHLSIHLSNYPSIYPSINLSIDLSIHPYLLIILSISPKKTWHTKYMIWLDQIVINWELEYFSLIAFIKSFDENWCLNLIILWCISTINSYFTTSYRMANLKAFFFQANLWLESLVRSELIQILFIL